MHEGLDATTIVFAVLAIFVVWKLKSVLGTRVDVEKRSPPTDSRPTGSTGTVIRLPGAAENAVHQPPAAAAASQAAKTDRGRAALAEIAAADPKFSVDRFLGGVRAAYEMIVDAFARGDRATLANLLSPEVLASFVGVIEGREARSESASTRVISIGDIEIVDGGVRNGMAQLSARISARMVTLVRDKGGAVVSGDPEVVVSTDDLWTFARQVSSADPTWRLIATESHQS